MPRGPGQDLEQGDQEMEYEDQGFRAQPKPAPPVDQGEQQAPQGGAQPGSAPAQAVGNLSPGGHTEEWFTGDGNWDQGNRWEEAQPGEAWGSVAQGRWGSASARDPWVDTAVVQGSGPQRDAWADYGVQGRQMAPGSDAARGQGGGGGKGWTRNTDGVWWEVGASDWLCWNCNFHNFRKSTTAPGVSTPWSSQGPC